jgi:hypothetical protein
MTLPAWAAPNPITTLQAQVAALQQTVSTQAGQIATLQSTVANQGTQITSLQKSLIPLLTVVNFDPAHSLVQFRGVNVQIVNGTGSTSTIDPKATGNLIIGYNEADNHNRGVCSDGISQFQFDCESAGGTWTRTLSGSHNLVIGSGNGYSSYGGMVVGHDGLITGSFAVVSGGWFNTASGATSSISGGYQNTASGATSSISGGSQNVAQGGLSSVSGGNGIEEGNGGGWAAGGDGTPTFHSP